MRRQVTVAVSVLFLAFAAIAESPSGSGHLANVNGIKLYYELTGEGEPLLLLHHFGGSSLRFASIVPEFAKTYRVIAIDLPGHGHSTSHPGQFTHRQAALDIFALLDSLGIKRIKAIGTSSGAMTLIHMATQQPERVESMILIGGTDQYPAETRAQLNQPDCETLSPEQFQFDRSLQTSDEQVRTLQHEFCGFAKSYDDMNFTPPFLSTITAQTLIIHGDRDGFFPVRIPVEMYTAIPHSYLWIVPNGGHIPMIFSTDDSKRAEFLRLAKTFLHGDWPVKK